MKERLLHDFSIVAAKKHPCNHNQTFIIFTAVNRNEAWTVHTRLERAGEGEFYLRRTCKLNKKIMYDKIRKDNTVRCSKIRIQITAP